MIRGASEKARELRSILSASGAFDPSSRAFLLVNALESEAVSRETEVRDLRALIAQEGKAA